MGNLSLWLIPKFTLCTLDTKPRDSRFTPLSNHRCEIPSNLQPQVRLFLLNPLHPNKKEIRI